MLTSSAAHKIQFGRALALAIACLLVVATASGCVNLTVTPSGNTAVAEVYFKTDMCVGTFEATLDGNDVTNDFSQPDPKSDTLRATFTNLAPGSHTLTVSAKTVQYWILFPYCDSYSDTATFNVTGPPLPTLSFSPAGPITVNAGSSANVRLTASTAPANATIVNLSSNPISNPNRISFPATTTIGPNATASATFPVAANIGGTAALTATAVAAGFQGATLNVTVLPVLSSLNPTSGAPGTTVTIAGNGFDSSASVRFGSQTAQTTLVSANQLTAVVPNVPAGQSNVTAVVNGQTSQGRTFQVTPAPPQTIVLIRSGAAAGPGFVETFSFTPSTGALASINSVAATAQGGMGVVGIAFNGQSNVLRASSTDVQSYSLDASNNLTAVGTPAASAMSGTGAAVAASGNTVVRASNLGLETYLLVGGVPQKRVQQPVAGAPSTTPVGVDLRGSFAIRSYSGGVEVYNISALTAPILASSAPGGLSAAGGGGVRFSPDGTMAVRATDFGIEMYSIAATGTAARVGFFGMGGGSPSQGAVAFINATGTQVVRAFSNGIEIYDVSTPGTPTLIGQRAGTTVSSTGVGVVVAGKTVFRATNSSLEAYDISNLPNIPAPTSINGNGNMVKLSSVGVALAVK